MSLRRAFHERISRLTTRRPRLVIALAICITVVAGRMALIPILNIDTDILNQLPSEMPEVEAYRRATSNFGAPDILYGVVETDDGEPRVSALIEAAQRLARAVDNPEFVGEVRWSLDPDTQDHYGEATGITHGLLLPTDVWSAVRRELFRPQALHRQALRLRHLAMSPLPPRIVRSQMEDPWRLSSTLRRHLLVTRGPVSFDPRSGHYMSPDGDMLLLLIRPLKPPTDLLFSQELMRHMREAADQVEAEIDGVQIGFVGPHAETLYDTSLLRQDVLSTALASGICVVMLFIIAFRRWSALLFVGIPLALGIIWTLGLVAVFIGHLTIITCAFAAIVLGLGIDFGIHIYNRFLEDRLLGHRTRESVQTALVEVGPGVFTGGITTAIAFFALLLSDFPGFRELGLIGGMGILCCMAAMYLVMPSLLMVLHHRRPRSKYHHLTSFGLEALADAVARRPRATLLVGLILTAWLGINAPRLTFEEDLFNLRSLPRDQRDLRVRVDNRFNLPGQPLLLTVSGGPDLQAALEINDLLHNRLVRGGEGLGIASIDSLRTLLPSVQGQERVRGVIAGFDIDQLRGELDDEFERVDMSAQPLDLAIRRLSAWKGETAQAPPLRLSLASRRSLRRLVTNYVVHEGDRFHVLIRVYPDRSHWSPSREAMLIDNMTRGLREDLHLASPAQMPLQATGVTSLVDALRDLIKRDLVLMVFVVTLAVVLILWVHFRSFRLALLVTVPVLTGLLWTLGLMAITGQKLNFINVLALPIIIGLGIDNGLHILERLLGSARGRIDVAMVKTGRAVVVTSLSTILGFGALSLASFRGIQQMGILALVGVAISLITAITLIPALVQATGNRQGIRGLLRPDLG